jgi:hypothetical protein
MIPGSTIGGADCIFGTVPTGLRCANHVRIVCLNGAPVERSMSAVLQESTELFREPGQTYLSPARFATTLELDLSVLANALGVHRNTMRLHPESPRTQERMRDYNRVFLALMSLKPDVRDAAFHMKNTPIRVLGQRTLFETVKDGDTEKAMRYLVSISSGESG